MIRYLLKKGVNGKPREKVLQEYIEDKGWIDVQTILEEDDNDHQTP